MREYRNENRERATKNDKTGKGETKLGKKEEGEEQCTRNWEEGWGKRIKKRETVKCIKKKQRGNERENKNEAQKRPDLTKKNYLYFGTTNKTTNSSPASNSPQKQLTRRPTAWELDF